MNNNDLVHFGIKGMKWGRQKMLDKLKSVLYRRKNNASVRPMSAPSGDRRPLKRKKRITSGGGNVYIRHHDDPLDKLVYTTLTHHGIPHQEWGVRNGPPYPLSRQVKAEAYGHKKEPSLEKTSSKQDKSKKKSIIIRAIEFADKNRTEQYIRRINKAVQKEIKKMEKNPKRKIQFEKKMADEREILSTESKSPILSYKRKNIERKKKNFVKLQNSAKKYGLDLKDDDLHMEMFEQIINNDAIVRGMLIYASKPAYY